MKLRGQLALLGLLTLVFPVAGWFLFQSLHRDLQDVMSRAVLDQAHTLAASLQPVVPDDGLSGLLPVAKLGSSLRFDGQDDDWSGQAPLHFNGRMVTPGVDDSTMSNKPGRQGGDIPVSRLRLGRDEAGHWWLWIHVTDSTPDRASSPGAAASGLGAGEKDAAENTMSGMGDALVLGFGLQSGIERLSFARQSEGPLRASQHTGNLGRWQGYWHELADGYVVEIRLPAELELERFGFAARDARTWPEVVGLTGTVLDTTPDVMALWPVVHDRHTLAVELRRLYQQSVLPPAQLMAVNDDGWILARVGGSGFASPRPWQWLYGGLYHWLLADTQEQPPMQWQNYRPDIASNDGSSVRQVRWLQDKRGGMLISATVPLGDGYLLLEKPLDEEQRALIHTLIQSALVAFGLIVAVLVVYLLYASVLALRVRRLNRAMRRALEDNKHDRLPSVDARDEIGELARGMSGLLGAVREHTDYLKAFGSRLSHELKTPLAVVQGSLDNLQAELGSHAPRHRLSVFLDRAREGTARMRFILNQLANLSRLHQALENAPLQRLDLCQFVRQYVMAYRSLLPRLGLELPQTAVWVRASPELLGQALDKLLDNAQDFTPPGGSIELSVCPEDSEVLLQVFNSGSSLPGNLPPEQLFERLVSRRNNRMPRQAGQEKHHLGLGLYLVRLIADHHGGSVAASNNTARGGVVFTVRLPVVD